MAKTHYFYQIDHINANNEAEYIDTFTARQRNKAVETVNILNRANMCLHDDTYFVLDKYASEDYDGETDRIIEENITNAESIKMHCARVRKIKGTKSTVVDEVDDFDYSDYGNGVMDMLQ